MVYVIGSPGGSRVKIGTSEDVPRRLAQLQSSSPVELEVLWQKKGGVELETALHRRFKSARAHGEWFDFPNGDPIATITEAFLEEQALLILAQQKKAREPLVPWEEPGGTVVMMNGVPMVMPPHTDGGWLCVARDVKRNRRCHRPMNGSSLDSCWAQWIVPGLGVLSGRSLDQKAIVPGDEVVIAAAIRRTLMQVCKGHEDSDPSTREPVAWRPFDLARDRHLVKSLSDRPMGYALLPGFEAMEATVREFAESLVPQPAE